MRRRHRGEFFFELEPYRHRIDADVLARQARQKKLPAVLLLDEAAKGVRNLEPALIIDSRRSTTPEHVSLLHSDPQNSTRILELWLLTVNRKMLCGQLVTPNFRLLIAPMVVRPKRWPKWLRAAC